MSERERLAAHAEALASHLIDRANDVEHAGSADDVDVPALFRGAADTIRRLLTLAAPAPAGPDGPYGPCPICGEPRPAHVPRQHVHTIIGAFAAGKSTEGEYYQRIQEVIDAQLDWTARGAPDCPLCGAPESYGHACPERRG